MIEANFVNLAVLSIGLGLLGFIEPCSMGSNLLFIKYLEGKKTASKIAQVGIFTLTRGLFIGGLGALVVLLGSIFIGMQKGAWIILGGVYVVIGVLFMAGKVGSMMKTIGPSLARLSGWRGSASLGVLFGLNIPACAAPLVFALLGLAATQGSTGLPIAQGFYSLSLFGLALSLPLVLAVLFGPLRGLLDKLAALSLRTPVWTGAIFVVLGLWSIWLGYYISLEDWA